MLARLETHAFDALVAGARRDPLPDVLARLGEAATGRRGFACNAGHVLAGGRTHGADEAPVIDGRGAVVARGRLSLADDPVLASLGLVSARVDDGVEEADQARLSLFALAVRLGLTARMLDRAHAHLKPRRSFGQKTLSHQLVKASFADVHGVTLRLREKAHVRLEEAATADLAGDHAELAEADGEAERLMGGHGYLAGGTHELGYLSMLLFSLYGRGACA